jgi:GAF domain-containing protein
MSTPGFCVLAADTGWLNLVEWPAPAWLLAGALAALALVLAAWGARERRLAAQPRSMRRLYRLGEKLLAGRTAAGNLSLLRQSLPDLLEITGVHVYLQDRASGTFMAVNDDISDGPLALPILTDDPVGFREKGVAACFRNRSLIAIPDTARSPFFGGGEAAPRAAMFVPMFAHEDLLGVLEISHDRWVRSFSGDQQAVAQHLANQMAAGMRLLEQKSIRERAGDRGRSEAICRLVEVTARELSEPLDAIKSSLQSLDGAPGGEPRDGALASIASEIGRAEHILSRVLQFATTAPKEEAGADFASIVRSVLDQRQPRWSELGIRLDASIPMESVPVAGVAPSYLEEVLRKLFQRVDEHLEDQREKAVRVKLSRLAGKAQLDIAWLGTRPAGDKDPRFAVCRGLIQDWGGELRLAGVPEGGRLEVEWPMAGPGVREPDGIHRPDARASSQLTALIVHPGLGALQALVTSLSDLGHRCITVAGVDEAVEVVGRLRFQVLFCSAHLPAPPWLECFERTRARVGAFILLTRTYDAALAAALPPGEAYTLAEPVRPEELRRLLEEMPPARFNGPAKYNKS